MRKVSQEEWNKRLEEVKLASQDCKTIAEIVEITDYSAYIIKKLFEQFPEEAKKIQTNLEKNKGKTKKKKRKKPNNEKRLAKILEASKTSKTFAEVSKLVGFSYITIKKILSVSPEVEKEVQENLAKNKNYQKEDLTTITQDDNDYSIVMLDTSINHVPNIFGILHDYVQKEKILGITDVVLEELANLQKINDKYGTVACNFLYIIMNNIPSFKLFEVKHTMTERETADEAIIRATLDLKGEALLLTSDKEMYIKTALKGGKVKYLPRSNREKEAEVVFDKSNSLKPKSINRKYMVDVVDVIVENMQATYIEKNRNNQVVKVFSRKGKEKQGTRIPLEVGDHIFICTAKEDCVTFVDYEIYDTTRNTCLMKFNKRFYHFESEVNVEIPEYKKFIVQARKDLIGK